MKKENIIEKFEKKILIISAFIFRTKANLLVLILGSYFFVFSDQGRDIIIGLSNDGNILNMDFFLFWFALFYFSFSLWYSAILKLFLKKINVEQTPFSERLIISLPYIYSSLLILIITISFIISTNYTIALIILITGIGFHLILNYCAKKTDVYELINFEKKEFKDLYKLDMKFVHFYFWIKVIVFLSLIFLVHINPKYLICLSRAVSTPIIISFFLAGVTTFTIIPIQKKNKLFQIIISVIIVLFILSPRVNNNNKITTLDLSEKKDYVSNDFRKWIEYKLSSDSISNKIPVFLVAAEGGGIRAMNWTALVLNKLCEFNEKFYEYTYAISGVSGGSVGMAFHQAYYTENNLLKDSSKFSKILGNDFLSPVIYAMLFPDLIHPAIPFEIPNSDRSKWLENSWSYDYKAEFSDKLDEPLLNLYKEKNKLPNLFFNSCRAESGQKAIISNLLLDSSYFENVIDVSKILEESGCDVPLKTAASLSARFPVVTSPGKIDSTDINLVDGGYFDNSGLGTVLQIYSTMINQLSETELNRIKIVIVFIKNSSEKSSYESNDFLVEIKSILSPIMKAWGQGSNTMKNLSAMTKTISKVETEFHTIALNRKNKELPLGWYLSPESMNEIQRQADALSNFLRLFVSMKWNMLVQRK